MGGSYGGSMGGVFYDGIGDPPGGGWECDGGSYGG